jgi:signal peptidase I
MAGETDQAAGAVAHGERRVSARGEPGEGDSHGRAVVEWVIIVVIALVGALLVKAFVVQAFRIPSQSMEPTLVPGDRVLVQKLSSSYHDGEVIVFRRPPNDETTDSNLIKRIIATGGQTVRVSHCRVYIDGKELKQPYLPKGWQDPSSEFCTTWVSGPGTANLPNPYTVPAGYYFVMGDNRTDSDDSRYWGPVPASYAVGEAVARVWPLDRLGVL